VANWIQTLVERLDEGADPGRSKVTPAAFAQLVQLVTRKAISRDAGREVVRILVDEGGEPEPIVEREGLGSLPSDDGGLAEIVAAAIAADPDAAERLRAGNSKAVGPLVGYVMRETKGRADGGEINRLIREQLGI
jgi:aspartyl-tRNA(Asn)/glutamyl-tRNA(Gln) amidotransferase subunit B